MSTLKYEAEGFCSACLRNNVVKALILNSKIVLSTVVCVASLHKISIFEHSRTNYLPQSSSYRNLHADKLIIREQFFQSVTVSHAKRKFRRAWIIR